MSAPTFKTWLMGQLGRDDGIGHLAREVSTCVLIGCLAPRVQSFYTIDNHMTVVHRGYGIEVARAQNQARLAYLVAVGRVTPEWAAAAARGSSDTIVPFRTGPGVTV